MGRGAREILQDMGRSTIGAMNLGLPLIYTMETWWLAWRLPLWLLGGFAIGGIVVIVVATHLVGFEKAHPGPEESWRHLAQAVVELMLSSFAAAMVVLFLFGIIEWGDPLQDVLRHGLIQVVPLGLGAAVANLIFRGVEPEERPPRFGKEMATFGMGAAFFAFAVAPTEEMELMAAHAGWWRLVAIVVFSVVFTYLVLYVLEFRGRKGRMAGMESAWLRWGETVAGYAVALALSLALLFSYGHLHDVPFAEVVQKTVVLSFIAAFGGAAARVVV